jgi:hypothetical protein
VSRRQHPDHHQRAEDESGHGRVRTVHNRMGVSAKAEPPIGQARAPSFPTGLESLTLEPIGRRSPNVQAGAGNHQHT